MSEDRDQVTLAWRQFRRGAAGDLLIWACLIVLVAASLAAAYAVQRPLNLIMSLAAAAVQVALLGLFFMRLRLARTLVVLTSGSAFLFVAVMFILTLNDLLSRV